MRTLLAVAVCAGLAKLSHAAADPVVLTLSAARGWGLHASDLARLALLAGPAIVVDLRARRR